MSMSIPYELNGRVDQKRRTRDALDRRGPRARGPRARRPRWRAPPSRRRSPARPPTATSRASGPCSSPPTRRRARRRCCPTTRPTTPPTRLDLVLDAFIRSTVENEAQQRMMLRLSLEAEPAERAKLPLRQGRGIKWIGEALAPLRDGDVRGRRSPPHAGDPERHRNRGAGVAHRCRRAVTRRRRRSDALVRPRPASIRGH